MCVCVGLSEAAELCLLSLLLLSVGLAIVESLTGVASVPLPTVPVVFRGVSCHRLPLEGSASFLAPVACPASAVELCLLGLRCLWCGAWFSSLCRALPPGPAVCAASLPQVTLRGFCLFWHRLPDLLLRWWRRLGGNPSLVLSVLLLLRMAGGSSLGSAPCVRELHRGCVCSLGDSVVVPFLALLDSRALLVVMSSPPAVLDLCRGCALFTACFPCLRVGALLAYGVSGASFLRSLQSRLPFVVGPSQVSVCPSPALAVGWFGHMSVAPPAATV